MGLQIVKGEMSPDENLWVGEKEVFVELALENSSVIGKACSPRHIDQSPAAEEEHSIPRVRNIRPWRELVPGSIIVAFGKSLNLLHANTSMSVDSKVDLPFSRRLETHLIGLVQFCCDRNTPPRCVSARKNPP